MALEQGYACQRCYRNRHVVSTASSICLAHAAAAGEDGAVLNLVLRGNVMKKSLAILLLSLVVGCSKAKE